MSLVFIKVQHLNPKKWKYHFFWSDMFRLENFSIWQIPVFSQRLADEKSSICCIEFETLEKQCWSYLRNIETAVNNFLQMFRTQSTPIGKIWLNIGICQTLGFPFLKMSPLNTKSSYRLKSYFLNKDSDADETRERTNLR
jgi:hypothetical protein